VINTFPFYTASVLTPKLAFGCLHIHHVPKKLSPLMFDNFGKCGPIFKILSPGDS